jgi:hypothetical protein
MTIWEGESIFRTSVRLELIAVHNARDPLRQDRATLGCIRFYRLNRRYGQDSKFIGSVLLAIIPAYSFVSFYTGLERMKADRTKST